MNASRQVTVTANTLTVGGAISGVSFGLTKEGSGTLISAGANTFNGAVVVNGERCRSEQPPRQRRRCTDRETAEPRSRFRTTGREAIISLPR